MRIFLLSLCLVGLGHAVPTPPSNVTDPFISALEDGVPEIASITWGKNASSEDELYTILCAGNEKLTGENIEVSVTLEEGDGDTPIEKTYPADIYDKENALNCYRIHGHGDTKPATNRVVLRVTINVLIKNANDEEKLKYGGKVSSFQKLTAIEDLTESETCPKGHAVTFTSTPNEDLGVGWYFNVNGDNLRKTNIFFVGENTKGIVTVEDSFVCIKDGIKYCQVPSNTHLERKTTKNVSQGGGPQIDLIQYGSKNVNLEGSLAEGNDYLFSMGNTPLDVDTSSSSDKIVLKSKIEKSSELYSLCDKTGNQLSSLQDLNVVVEKGTVQGETYWTFSFNKQEGKKYYYAKAAVQNSLQGPQAEGFDATVIDCSNMGDIGTCYGFLVPKTDPAKTYMSLSYSNDDKGSTLSNAIVQTVPGDT